MIKIQMMPSSITQVPFQAYAKDFTFIINGEKFETSQIISDLLSPTICKLHNQDPTIDTFIINTHKRGDFSQILKLCTFQQFTLSEENYDFFVEVIEQLGNESIQIKKPNKNCITNDNVLTLVKKHEQMNHSYFKHFEYEIEYASSHFFELCESKQKELKELQVDTLLQILNNDQLRLKTEDQLIEFINELYINNSKYSILYETVKFENVSVNNVRKFISIFDFNEMTNATWARISTRLEQEIIVERNYKDRYEEQSEMTFIPTDNNSLTGIINYLKTQSNNNIFNEIKITTSSCGNPDERHKSTTVVQYDNVDTYYVSKDSPNSWLCIDFIKRRVMLTDYIIRSIPYTPNNSHLKSWKIEGSNDNANWVTLDEQENCSHLNSYSATFLFHINQAKSTTQSFRYLRIQQTGKNWRNFDQLQFNSIEFFGTLLSTF